MDRVKELLKRGQNPNCVLVDSITDGCPGRASEVLPGGLVGNEVLRKQVL